MGILIIKLLKNFNMINLVKGSVKIEEVEFICTRCGDSKIDQLTYVGEEKLCDSCYYHEDEEIEIVPPTKNLYIIKDYRIWAYSEKEALDLLQVIESF
jgi:hypothetical protein